MGTSISGKDNSKEYLLSQLVTNLFTLAVSAHDKKVQITSFGGSTIVEGHSGTTAEKSSGQNTGALGMCLTVKKKLMITLLNHTDDSVFKNRSFQEFIIEEKDAGVKEKELVEDKELDSGSHGGSKDGKKSAVKDEDVIVQLLAVNPLAIQVGLSDTVACVLSHAACRR